MRPTQPKEGRYRTKIEVLRDFLRATQQGSKKTRIIGLANLNPASFRKYRDSCLSLELIQSVPGGYALTARAEVVLDRIDRLLEMTSEMESAVAALERALGPPEGRPSFEDQPLRYVSRIAWEEAARAEHPVAREAVLPAEASRSAGRAEHDFKFWWERPFDSVSAASLPEPPAESGPNVGAPRRRSSAGPPPGDSEFE